MSLLAQIQEDIKSALRSGERLKLTTLRILLSAIKKREKDIKQEITEDVILAIIEKQVQLRKEAAELYEAANRLTFQKRKRRSVNIARIPSRKT